ncbi:hypothetical protein MKW98_030681 [Papaver atlanticum]|uniref:Uncharacterized protein n=1 Tax=Papaver atlanticum TaxID=357466 RepID=A0AAD4RU50_9MAGN|nr:hypothetical protein MKW98_030681 [Papaver atlanticum]
MKNYTSYLPEDEKLNGLGFSALRKQKGMTSKGLPQCICDAFTSFFCASRVTACSGFPGCSAGGGIFSLFCWNHGIGLVSVSTLTTHLVSLVLSQS